MVILLKMSEEKVTPSAYIDYEDIRDIEYLVNPKNDNEKTDNRTIITVLQEWRRVGNIIIRKNQ